MTCAHCGKQVPQGRFCTDCGADQAAAGGRARARWHSYAAHPGERVSHLNVLSTLLPHLGQRRVHDFRLAFVSGLVCLTILYLLGLIGAAILAAALLVPALYLLYLREAQVYKQEPGRVLLGAMGGGAVIGLAMALLVDHLAGRLPLAPRSGVGTLLGLGALVPALQELVKPVPALVLSRRRAFGETLDGFTIGVAAGLGFALAQTLTSFAPAIGVLPFRVDPAAWIHPLIGVGVLLPLLQASCTGAVSAALWGRRDRPGLDLISGGLPVAIVAHVSFVLGSQLLLELGAGPITVLLWQALVVALMILYGRALLHRALLLEATDLGLAEASCVHCGRHGMAAGFCPDCGLAMSASPRTGS